MERITDELRGLMGESRGVFTDRIAAIADRIDAEHERRLSAARNEGLTDGWDDGWNNGYDEGFASADDWYAKHEDELAEHGYIKLPKDADGEFWRIGDADEHGRRIAVMCYCGSAGWSLGYGDGFVTIHPGKLRHHHAPTVEDVLREFANDIAEVLGGDDFKLDGSDELFAEYAAKLRLKEQQ